MLHATNFISFKLFVRLGTRDYQTRLNLFRAQLKSYNPLTKNNFATRSLSTRCLCLTSSGFLYRITARHFTYYCLQTQTITAHATYIYHHVANACNLTSAGFRSFCARLTCSSCCGYLRQALAFGTLHRVTRALHAVCMRTGGQLSYEGFACWTWIWRRILGTLEWQISFLGLSDWRKSSHWCTIIVDGMSFLHTCTLSCSAGKHGQLDHDGGGWVSDTWMLGQKISSSALC